MLLDHTDRHILELLQRDCTRTHKEIGRDVGLSPSATRRRIATLRATGAITREVALVSDAIEQPGITVLVSVTFDQESPAAYDTFRHAMGHDGRVRQCYATAGQHDFVLVVRATSPADHEAWTAGISAAHPLRRIESAVVWSTVKFTTIRTLGAT